MKWEYLNDSFIEVSGNKPAVAVFKYNILTFKHDVAPRFDILFRDDIGGKITRTENDIQLFIAGILAAVVMYRGNTTLEVMRELQTLNWERSVNQAKNFLKDA